MKGWTSIVGVCLAAFLCANCSMQRAESVDFAEAVGAAVNQMNQTGRTEDEFEHVLGLDVPTLVAIVPASGLDLGSLPPDATAEQIASLSDIATAWRDDAFLAIIWPGGSSFGNTIARFASVPRQVSVVKPPRGTVVVRLIRDSSGEVSIAELR